MRFRCATRRPRKVYTAADWPFYRDGVNPVAAHTPDDVHQLALVYIDLCRHLGDEPWITRAELTEHLQAEGLRNKYHRAGDQLVGLFDRLSGHSELSVVPAFSRLF